MSLAKAQPFPNLFLTRPDATSLELTDLRKKEHCLLILQSRPHPDVQAFISHFQDQAKLFNWLNTRLVVVYPRREEIPTPWPAPAYPPCLYAAALPEGVAWDQAYVISKNGTLTEFYGHPGDLSVAKVEKDLLYWEAGHCLP